MSLTNRPVPYGHMRICAWTGPVLLVGELLKLVPKSAPMVIGIRPPAPVIGPVKLTEPPP